MNIRSIIFLIIYVRPYRITNLSSYLRNLNAFDSNLQQQRGFQKYDWDLKDRGYIVFLILKFYGFCGPPAQFKEECIWQMTLL